MMIGWFFVWISGFPSFLQGSFGMFEANQRANYGIKGLNYIILAQVKLLYMIRLEILWGLWWKEWFSEVCVRILATYCSCYLWTNKFQWSRIDSGLKSACDMFGVNIVTISNNGFDWKQFFQFLLSTIPQAIEYHHQLNKNRCYFL